jgi:hypothetical protein
VIAGVLRSVGLWLAVLHRSRADWPVVLAAGLLLVCATTLLATGSLYAETVADSGLRRAFEAAPVEDRTVQIAMTVVPADVAAADAAIQPAARETLGTTGGEVALVGRSGSFAAAGAGSDVRDLTQFASFSDLADHAALLEGAWPSPGGEPIEAVLSDAAARELGLAVGDGAMLASRLDPSLELATTVVGIYRPDRADAYWLGQPLELDGVEPGGSFTTRGPFVVASEDLARTAPRQVNLAWRILPAVSGMRAEGLDALRHDVRTLADRVRVGLPAGTQVRITTQLPQILDEVERSVLVSRSGIVLLTIQFAVLAGYSVILVAGMLLERRRTETALLRSRGATTAHLGAMAFTEAVLVAIPAVLVAPFLALGLVRLATSVGPLAGAGFDVDVVLTRTTFAVAAVAGVACVIALTLPALWSASSPAGIRASLGRGASRTLAQRLGIDLALVAVAAIALWQLRLYGAPLTRNARGVLGVDPLLIAAPAIGLLAGAVLATRIVPRLAELSERWLERRRGLLASLGGRQLARRPLRYTRAALLLMLAAALGTFASAHAATWLRSQADQAAYQAVTDLRVVASDYPKLPSWAIGPAYRAIHGVESATPVVRGTVDAGRTVRGAALLGLSPERATALSGSGVFGQLADRRPESAAIDLPGDPRRLALMVDADLEPDPGLGEGPDFSKDYRGLRAAVVIEDGDGRFHRFEAPDRGLISGVGQRLVIPLEASVRGTPVRPKGPLRLRSLELGYDAPANSGIVGTLDLTGLEASAEATGTAWEPVRMPTDAGWSWLQTDAFSPSLKLSQETALPMRVPVTQTVFSGNDARVQMVPQAGVQAIPAVVDAGFLELTGAEVGDRVAGSISGLATQLEIVGTVDLFAPLDPNEPFVIVDATTLDLARFAATQQTVPTDEWWLTVDPARSDTVAATLAEDPYSSARVIGRDELRQALVSDPLPLGLIGVLGLGSLAAIAFAAIGFVVSATVSTTERSGEFALLRALGLSGRELSAWLSVESAFLLVVGLAAGLGLGLLLAWLVLPFATLTQTGAAAVPAPVVVVPWEAILPVYLVAGLLLAGMLVVIRRRLPAVNIGAALRARDD